MGVPGLWEILNKAGHSRSLANLSIVDGFERNESGSRAFRVGIDVSLWYQHTPFSKGGANPEIRLLFFRLANLSQLPILPLFVFDGCERPKVKRGSKVGKAGSHNLTEPFKKLLDHFGMEWRTAFGEAEAELAYLNRVGHIDAIMTDDVDALIFGAKTIIKNPSLSLSGNKNNPALNSEGKPSKDHVMVYNAEDVANHPQIGLTRGGLILFALLSGGDYDTGVKGCGPQLAHALARCGYGDELLSAFERRARDDIRMFLINWRQKLDHELRTNERGMLPRKAPSVTIPSDFPDLQVLKYYAEPLCSATRNKSGGPIRDNSDLSLPRIAGFCEQYFDEWGHRSMIVKRFRDLLWESALMRVMRRAAIEADLKEKNNRLALRRDDLEIHGPLTPSIEEGVGTPAALVQRYLDPAMVDRIAEAFVNRGPQAGPNDRQNIPDLHPLVVKIVSNRRHVSTDHLLEYRLEIDPHQFVTLTNRGILGSRPDPPINPRPVNEIDNVFQESSQRTQTSPKTPKNAPPDPLSIMRVWLAASIVRQVHPKLVQDYEDAEAAKNAAKAAPSPKKRKGKERAKDDDPMDEDEEPEPTPPRRRPAPRPRPVVPPVTSQVATPPVPRNEETPRSVAPARITETPRVVETPRAMETPRAVETHRTVEHPRHAVHPRLVETPRITMPPPPVKAPLVIEPLRSVAPQRPVESPRSTNPPRPISQPRPEVAPRITEPPRAVQPPLLAEPVQIAEPPRVQLPLQPVPFTNPKDPLEIPVDSESSLPQRLCGFKFTYPNPDNPDYLLSDDEDEESRRPVIYYRKYVPSSSSFTQAAEAGPSNTAKSRYDEIYNRILDVASSSMDLQPTQSGSHHSSTPRASQSRPHAPSPTPASVLPFAPPPLSSAAGPSSYAPIPRTPISRYDAVINEDFGTMDNSGSAKRKETSRKRSRAPTEDEQQEQRHPSGSQGSGKRRRQTKELQVPSNSPPPPTPTPQRILAPFPYIPPLRDLSPSPPLPTFISHSRTNSGRRPIPEDRSIISVHSDDEYPSVASSSQRRRQPIPLDASIISLHSDDDEPGPPTSSLMNPQAQASISSSQPFRSSILQDDDVIIDLT